tara:strand:+ start:37 stop:495 length:459 start_codon:yes stop_codon:yes gene_type:complete
MFKKTFILVFFLFLSSCGYEAIHSVKNSIDYNFSISEITFEGDRVINLKIKERLNNYILTENQKGRNFILKISSVAEKIVLAKNIAGDPTNFKSTVTVNIEVRNKNKLQIVENFNYNNIENKIDLKRYERQISNNLAVTVTDKLIFKLSNIQ